jgi:uncharacterized protein YigA (DUF484 family)
MSRHSRKKIQLTAYPLNGERLQLKRIDHTLLKICMNKAYQDINDPNSEIHKQLKNLLDCNSLDKTIDAFVNWYEDIGVRMSEDIELAGCGTRDRKAEKDELSAIIQYSRDHIRIDQGGVEVI